MIPKIRVFAKAGVKSVFGGGYDTDQMFYEIRDIDFYDKEVTVWGCQHKDCGMCDDTYRIEDVEIMMSTGLKDKNGVEIYAGDILDIKANFKRLGFVIFDHGKFKVQHVEDTVFYDFTQVLSQCEVIGNVFENKEAWEMIE